MRIVSLAPGNTEILFAIGAGGQTIARTAYCDYPKEALRIPKIGDWLNPNIEEIERLKPDLILTSTIVQEKLAGRLLEKGLPVVHFDPRTLDGVFESIAQTGELTGRQKEADGLILRMEDDLAALARSIEGKTPRMYIEEWHEPPFASGNWVPKIAQIAGAEYEMAEEGELSREFAFGELERFDPEIILLSICGVRLSPQAIYGRPGWESLSAVKAKNVFSIDDSLLNRPGPRLVEGARELRKIISFWRTSA